MDSLYPELKKKMKKNYGVEKEGEMEKHLIEKFGLYSKEQAVNRIKEEFKYAESTKEVNWRLFLKTAILSYLDMFQNDVEYQHLSNNDLYLIIGETFNLDPEFFMNLLYSQIRQGIKKENRLEMDQYLIEESDFIVKTFKMNPKLFMEKFYYQIYESILKLYGDERSWEIIKDIIKKYCLYDGEHIEYEFIGDIAQYGSTYSAEVVNGRILLTNYRFIANGNIKTTGMNTSIWKWSLLWHGNTMARKGLSEWSAQQGPICYGYQFPIIDLYKLKKQMSYTINYRIKMTDSLYSFKVSCIGRNTDISTNAMHRDNLYEILSKEFIGED